MHASSSSEVHCSMDDKSRKKINLNQQALPADLRAVSQLRRFLAHYNMTIIKTVLFRTDFRFEKQVSMLTGLHNDSLVFFQNPFNISWWTATEYEKGQVNKCKRIAFERVAARCPPLPALFFRHCDTIICLITLGCLGTSIRAQTTSLQGTLPPESYVCGSRACPP